MAHDQSITDTQHPLENLAYDFVNVVKHKADALVAYQKYIHDAEEVGSQECLQLFRKLYEDDARHLEEAKRHLSEVLMGNMGQPQQQKGQKGQGQRINPGGRQA